MFGLFLVGWGLSFIWGPISDRFGSTKSLAATILVYALFTGAAAFSSNVSYHNGSIWPHDNAMIATGLARYGDGHATARIFQGMDPACAGRHMDSAPKSGIAKFGSNHQ
jgi:MFS family permease